MRNVNVSRLFIDLIHSASGKWANWDPSIPVEVHAFGSLLDVNLTSKLQLYRSATMELSTRNLENLKELAAYMIPIWNSMALAYRSSNRNLLLPKNTLYAHPSRCAHSNFQLVQVCKYPRGFTVCRICNSVVAHFTPRFLAPTIIFSQLAGQADASIHGQWKFGRNRGALLIISRPQIKHLPTEFPYERLRDISVLARKVIVMDVVICPAYALYLSQESELQFPTVDDGHI